MNAASPSKPSESLSFGQRQLLANVVTHGTLILIVLIMLFPAVWVLITSFKTEQEIESSRITIIPENPTLENYEYFLTEQKEISGGRGEPSRTINIFVRRAWNSFFVSAITTVIGVLLAATTAYAFSRFQFIGRRPMLIAFLVTQMFPGAILIIPLYNLLNEWGLLDRWEGLVLSYCTTALPFSVWMLKGFFDAIPYDLEEAAIVDGTTAVGAFWRIALPLTLPGIAVVGFYNFMTAWNEFMLAFTFMTSQQNQTLPVGLRSFFFQFDADWHIITAGSVVVTIPVMLGFFWAQRYLVAGLTSGGVKG
jgi:arabinogalactan oligomer/maltooligosaccharide transport system permease protein